MEQTVLVAFATTHGATGETAERIGAVLRKKMFEVHLKEARSVRSLEGYQAVILGFPMYMFKIHKDGRRFLSRFRQELSSSLPLAIFTGGPIEPDKLIEQMQDAETHLQKNLESFPEIPPVSVLMIGGRFDPESLQFPYSLIPAMKQLPAADLRDWDEISAWAEKLPEKLGLV